MLSDQSGARSISLQAFSTSLIIASAVVVWVLRSLCVVRGGREGRKGEAEESKPGNEQSRAEKNQTKAEAGRQAGRQAASQAENAAGTTNH